MWELSFTAFVIISLATFRLTRLIVWDKITEHLRAPFFDEVSETLEDGTVEVYLVPKPTGIRKWIGELLGCFWCTGVWAAAFLIGLSQWLPVVGKPLVLLLAVAGLALIFELIVRKMNV